MNPSIDHISITVSDLERAEKFYDSFLPIVGFDVEHKNHDEVPEHFYKAAEYLSPSLTFCLINPRAEYINDRISRRRPGSVHHLAFRVENKEQVDEAFKKIQSMGAEIIHEPQFWPNYCDSYYAFFIKDSEGIELEIVHYFRS